MSTAPAQSPAKPKHNPRRTAILLGILGLGVVMLAYDFYVARPACDAGMTKMEAILAKSMTAKANQSKIDPATVQKELGFAPSSTDKVHDYYTIETYKWRGGLPFRSYNVYVVYRGLEKPVLHNVTQNQYPDDDIIPAKTIKSQPVANNGGTATAVTTPPDPTITEPKATGTEPKATGSGEENKTSKDQPAQEAKPSDTAKPGDEAKNQ